MIGERRKRRQLRPQGAGPVRRARSPSSETATWNAMPATKPKRRSFMVHTRRRSLPPTAL